MFIHSNYHKGQIIMFRAVFVLFLLCSFNVFAAEKAEQKLTFAAIENSEFNKFAARVIKATYSKIDYDVDALFLPGKRALQMSSSGILDGESNRVGAIAERYPTLIKVPTPFTEITATAFYIDDNISVRKREDLAKYRLGVLNGVVFSKKITKGYNSIGANSVNALFKILQNNRVDIVIFTEFSGQVEIAKNFKHTGIKSSPVALLKIPVFNYLHRKHRKLVPLVDAAIREMLQTGEIDNIRRSVIGQLSS